MSSTIPLPPREQLCNRYYSTKHTQRCVECLLFKDTKPSPLQDSLNVRQKGGLLGPPPTVPVGGGGESERAFKVRGKTSEGLGERLGERELYEELRSMTGGLGRRPQADDDLRSAWIGDHKP